MTYASLIVSAWNRPELLIPFFQSLWANTFAGALCWTTAIAQAHDYFVSGQNPDTYEPDLEAE